MKLSEIDLNLLLVFKELIELKNVSKVALALNISQPGVSNALKRLRVVFNDELFMRTAKGMEPTAYALSIESSIRDALELLRSALNQTQEFDPLISNKRFCIAMTDLGEIYFMPKLMKLLAKEAPGITVSTVRNSQIDLQEEMADGRVNLAIGLLPQLKTGYHQKRLFKQRYVCMYRDGHVFNGKSLTLPRYRDAEHVIVVSGGTGHALVDQLIEAKCPGRNIKLVVPHFVALGHILQSTDLVATVPEIYAQESLKPFNLKYQAHPIQLPEIDINLFWHSKYHKDPATQWLRSILVNTFGH